MKEDVTKVFANYSITGARRLTDQLDPATVRQTNSETEIERNRVV